MEHVKSFLKPFITVIALASLPVLMNMGNDWVKKEEPEPKADMSTPAESKNFSDCKEDTPDRRIRLNELKPSDGEDESCVVEGLENSNENLQDDDSLSM